MDIETTRTEFGQRIGALERALDSTTDLEHRLSLLDELTFLYIYVDMATAVKFGRIFYRESKRSSEARWRALSLLLLGDILDIVGESVRGQTILERAWTIATRRPSTPRDKARICRSLARCYANNAATELAFAFSAKAMAYARESGDGILQGDVLVMEATILKQRSEISRATEVVAQARGLYEAASDAHGLALVYWSIGNLNAVAGKHRLAFAWLRKASNINRRVGSNLLQAHLVYDAGRELLQLGYTKRAGRVQRSAARAFRRMGLLQFYAFCLIEIGYGFGTREDHETAYRYFNHALELSRSDRVRQFALLALGQYHVHMQQWDQAIEAFHEVLHLCGRYSTEYNRWFTHRELAEVYEAQGNMQLSAYHYAEFVRLQRARIGHDIMRSLSRLDTQDMKAEQAQVLEDYRNRVSFMEEEAERRRKELSSLSNRVSSGSQFLEDLKKRLLLVNADGSSDERHGLPRIIDEIDRNDALVDAWKNFQEQLDRLDHDYATTLMKRCPDLTEAEFRICVLLRLNLSNKEIAELLDISDRTVDTHRTRIRRKLDLSGKDNLITTLSAL